MLNRDELDEIKERLERSQNPLFFFDNDVDGLCSFLILRRSIGRGRGVAIKSFPDLKEQYIRKVEELNPDAVFILDKAEVSKEFVDAVELRGIPITWIDHHESKTSKEIIEKTSYYNSMPSAEPVTYIAQKVFNRQEDLWLATIGCISDVYMPDFASKFQDKYPELFNSKLSAFDALHGTEVGKVAKMLSFGLMDTITNVVKLIKYLFKAKDIYSILEENQNTKQLHKRYAELNEFYNKQLEKAEDSFDKNSPVLFFSYSGKTSMSSEIANRLFYDHKDKLIVVAFKRPEKTNISIRGKNALKITYKAIEGIQGATGGGHEEATGAMTPIDDFEKFKENIMNCFE
jgi:oligoribonuclease NrnB/cAMP/cGMP phosphodiesterase (DHH superfamily)